jgi:DNA-binding ferritin-like protein (Dps family)
MARTRAQQNKAIRQESLREFMAAKCTVQHAIDCIEEHRGLDPTEEHFKNRAEHLTKNFDMRMRVIEKYCPSLKATEIEHSVSDDLIRRIERTIVDSEN